MKGHALFQGEIVVKLQKYLGEIQKLSSEEPLGQFQPNLAQSFIEWIKGTEDFTSKDHSIR